MQSIVARYQLHSTYFWEAIKFLNFINWYICFFEYCVWFITIICFWFLLFYLTLAELFWSIPRGSLSREKLSPYLACHRVPWSSRGTSWTTWVYIQTTPKNYQTISHFDDARPTQGCFNIYHNMLRLVSLGENRNSSTEHINNLHGQVESTGWIM